MAISDLLSIIPKTTLGSIEVQALIEEVNTDTVQVTEHPVEQGAVITDHAFKKPMEIILKCGWSNSDITSSFSTISSAFSGGSMPSSSFIGNIYSQLLALQEKRIPFKVVTGKRKYDNMLITGLQATTDNKTSGILMISVTCREIIIVQTSATTLPPAANQANPESTSETTDSGAKQAAVATPSPGGSVPPGNM